MFLTADPKEIKQGKLTDIYFIRTMQILKARKIDKRVKAEFIAKRFPEDYGWGVLAGIEETAHLLKDLKVTVRAMREGSIFRAFEPVMEIEGMYTEFGLFETSLLGLLCQASGVATKAFDEIIYPKVKRVSLMDTFNDEKIEVIRAAEALGKKLFGIRLDTPSSRR